MNKKKTKTHTLREYRTNPLTVWLMSWVPRKEKDLSEEGGSVPPVRPPPLFSWWTFPDWAKRRKLVLDVLCGWCVKSQPLLPSKWNRHIQKKRVRHLSLLETALLNRVLRLWYIIENNFFFRPNHNQNSNYPMVIVLLSRPLLCNSSPIIIVTFVQTGTTRGPLSHCVGYHNPSVGSFFPITTNIPFCNIFRSRERISIQTSRAKYSLQLHQHTIYHKGKTSQRWLHRGATPPTAESTMVAYNAMNLAVKWWESVSRKVVVVRAQRKGRTVLCRSE